MSTVHRNRSWNSLAPDKKFVRILSRTFGMASVNFFMRYLRPEVKRPSTDLLVPNHQILNHFILVTLMRALTEFFKEFLSIEIQERKSLACLNIFHRKVSRRLCYFFVRRY